MRDNKCINCVWYLDDSGCIVEYGTHQCKLNRRLVMKIEVKANKKLFDDAKAMITLSDYLASCVQNDMEVSIDEVKSVFTTIAQLETKLAEFKVNLGRHIRECNK